MERSDFRPWTLDIPCWILDIPFFQRQTAPQYSFLGVVDSGDVLLNDAGLTINKTAGLPGSDIKIAVRAGLTSLFSDLMSDPSPTFETGVMSIFLSLPLLRNLFRLGACTA
jgi:hypothetical protein